jgi:hypothetical protein
MPSSEHDRRLRAELADELGYYPASLAPEDIESHRRLNAALDAAPTLERIASKFAHLQEQRRYIEVEREGRVAVSDLYQWGGDDEGEGLMRVHGVVDESGLGPRR